MDGEHKTTGSPPDLSQAIDRILAHPELISMVASALGGASAPAAPAASTDTDAVPVENPRPADSGESLAPKELEPPASGADPAALMTSLAPLLSGLGGKGSGIGGKPKDDNRTCLLRALKPYVNPGRQEAIEYMIRFTQITDLLKHMV
ncbi:MAG: hypothetical protein IJW44_04740 [Clostridia bacterium]|nr:hypothetical protein [Clostridia bacterium]